MTCFPTRFVLCLLAMSCWCSAAFAQAPAEPAAETVAAPAAETALQEPAAGEEPEAPKTITIWRQGRFEGRPRREQGNRNARGNDRNRGAAPAEGEASGEKRAFRGKPRGDGPGRAERGPGNGPQRGRDERQRGGKPGGKRRWAASRHFPNAFFSGAYQRG